MRNSHRLPNTTHWTKYSFQEFEWFQGRSIFLASSKCAQYMFVEKLQPKVRIDVAAKMSTFAVCWFIKYAQPNVESNKANWAQGDEIPCPGSKKESISFPAPYCHPALDQVTTVYILDYCQQPPSLRASRVPSILQLIINSVVYWKWCLQQTWQWLPIGLTFWSGPWSRQSRFERLNYFLFASLSAFDVFSLVLVAE